ncbi:hypothetical protein UlMin_024942 [Ulmus minor]
MAKLSKLKDINRHERDISKPITLSKMGWNISFPSMGNFYKHMILIKSSPVHNYSKKKKNFLSNLASSVRVKKNTENKIRKRIEADSFRIATRLLSESTRLVGDGSKRVGDVNGNRKNPKLKRTTRNSFIPTRKSLPVLKMVNEAEIPKEEARSSEKSIEESGCPVQGKGGRIVAPRVNNGRTNLWRNRVSDGFIITGRTSGDSRTLSRKSVRPIVKTTLKTSNVRNNTMSKNTSGPNKLKTAATTSKEAVKSSASENIIQESTHGQLPSDGNSIPSTSDTNARKSSNRRKSYTLLLVERSKLLEENDEGLQQEKLPSIDDERNQLEVSDYVDEIYQYYWVTEAQNPPRANYMTIQTDITPQMRSILINWLIEVHFKFDLMQETLYLTVTLLDRFLSEVTIKKNEMQLVGLTSLLLASKYEDFWHPRVKELISISAESYTRDQMLEMEKLILKKLKFRLNTPTPYVFMLRFLKAARSDTKVEHLAFYLIELCLLEYEALTFKPSLLCASAIYVARCTLRMTPPWTPLLSKHARYDVSQIRECAEMMLRLQKTARVGQLKVVYEKYMRSDLSVVAAIKPLEKLPL